MYEDWDSVDSYKSKESLDDDDEDQLKINKNINITLKKEIVIENTFSIDFI